ncbi:MAG: hypothetical protein KDK08_01725 [Rhizobiaceae bacterium]|nr:hypothetical protein [Rhizobiaceae bacterium]
MEERRDVGRGRIELLAQAGKLTTSFIPLHNTVLQKVRGIRLKALGVFDVFVGLFLVEAARQAECQQSNGG